MKIEKKLEDRSSKLGQTTLAPAFSARFRRVNALGIREVEPWHEAVDGKVLLDELADVLTRFVVLPKHAARTLALWVVHTYAFELRDVSTYIGIESPEKRCGKTTLLALLSELVCRPVVAANISSPAFFRVIEELRPTLLIDEADTFLQGNDELRGILNSGYARSTAFVVRVANEVKPQMDTDEHRILTEGNGGNEELNRTDRTNIINAASNSSGSRLASFSCWCPKVMAAIGRLPDTLADRCIVIRMQRKSVGESCERLRLLDPEVLRRKCARFVLDHQEEIALARPQMPPELNDRAADVWEPLLVLADLVGGDLFNREERRERKEGEGVQPQMDTDEHGFLNPKSEIRDPNQISDSSEETPGPENETDGVKAGLADTAGSDLFNRKDRKERKEGEGVQLQMDTNGHGFSTEGNSNESRAGGGNGGEIRTLNIEHSTSNIERENAAKDGQRGTEATQGTQFGNLTGVEQSWAVAAREAAVCLTGIAQENNPIGSLLMDILFCFSIEKAERVFSRTLVRHLNWMSGRPWNEMTRKKTKEAPQGVTEVWLARVLRPYGVRPCTMRIGEAVSKGYSMDDFTPVFRRYIPMSEVDDLKARLAGKSPEQVEREKAEKELEEREQVEEAAALARMKEIARLANGLRGVR